jgi:hypothetical protein
LNTRLGDRDHVEEQSPLNKEGAPEQESHSIDWLRLSREFLTYRTDEEVSAHETGPFAEALVQPTPRFVQCLLQQRRELGEDPGEAARALYCFLLQERYEERLNLLHFAFSIFEEETSLPDEIVARTPFPHEDGVPSFRHHGDPDHAIPMPDCEQ